LLGLDLALAGAGARQHRAIHRQQQAGYAARPLEQRRQAQLAQPRALAASEVVVEEVLHLAEHEAFPAILQQELLAQGLPFQLVNAAESGRTTAGGVTALAWVLRTKPDVVVIELGGNDGLQGRPVQLIHSNLAKMIELCRDLGAEVVLAGMMMPPNYGDKYTNGFTGLYADLAEDHDAALIPFFMDGVALEPTKMQRDQIHPNAAGQPILLDNVWPVLRELL